MHVLALLGGGLLHPLGSCTGTHAQYIACRGYNFWSGIASDVGEVTLITAVLAGFYGAYRKHKCGHCWRPARHVVHVHTDSENAFANGTQSDAAHSTTYPSCHKHLDHDHAAKARA